MEPSGGDAAPPNLAAPPGVSPAMSPVTAPATADVAEHVSQFDALFADHYARLVRALTLVAGDREVAADAVQEAFVRAHLKWRKISRYDDPIGWVRRVAINQIRDAHRRHERKSRALRRLASRETTVAHPVEPDDFGRLLAALPTQQRAATALYYVDRLSIAEIAIALGIAEGSVKSHLHDARRRLKPLLEGERS